MGWVTAVTAVGEALLHILSRPVYEVTTAAKVRRRSDTLSRYACQLVPGTRLHVVETRRSSSGSQRVAVRLLMRMHIPTHRKIAL